MAYGRPSRVHRLPLGVAMDAVDELLRETQLPRRVEPLVDTVDQLTERQTLRGLGEAGVDELADVLDVGAALAQERSYLGAAGGRPVNAREPGGREPFDQVDGLQIRVDVRVGRAELRRPVEPQVDGALD